MDDLDLGVNEDAPLNRLELGEVIKALTLMPSVIADSVRDALKLIRFTQRLVKT